MQVGLESLISLDAHSFPYETPVRLDIRTPTCAIPLLAIRRRKASRLVVLSNGAVALEQSNRQPVFQRSTWWREIDAHQIYVCDPGTVGSEALSLSWGQLNADHWAIPDAAISVQRLAAILGAPEPTQRTYFGSSAGGFWSVGLASEDRGAQVVINNAQFDWTRWMPDAVNALRKNRFDNLLPTELRERYPLRTNMLARLGEAKYPTKLRYFVNLASKHDRLVDYPLFQDYLYRYYQSIECVTTHCYSDAQRGHNPLSKEQTLRILNASW